MKGSKFVAFVAGALIGSGITWFVTKDYYEKIRDDEAADFVEKIKELKNEKGEAPKHPNNDNSVKDPKSIAKENNEKIDRLVESAKKALEGHVKKSYSDVEEEPVADSDKKLDHKKVRDDIVEITESDYYDDTGKYEKCGITLYADKVFTDDADRKMDDGYLSETIGIEIRNKLVDSDMLDAVYVRNYKTGRDYEIINDLNTWDEAHENYSDGKTADDTE